MVDVNKPIENPELVSAIEAIQAGFTAETEVALFECLKEANFLMVLHSALQLSEPDADGKATLAKGTTISFPMLSDANGHPIYFGFTDWPSLYAWKEQPDQQALIIHFSELPDLILREGFDCTGFLINPSTHNFFLPREILISANRRDGFYTVQEDTAVKIGIPKDYPTELVNAVKATLKTLKDVKKAWLLLMVKGSERSYLIVLEHTGDQATISPAVGNVAKKYLENGMFVDIVTTEQDFGRNAIKDKKPFYKRGLFG